MVRLMVSVGYVGFFDVFYKTSSKKKRRKEGGDIK
jgi:hypothetical protein